MPAGISHCEARFHARSAFHKSKGFISLKKALAFHKCFFLEERMRFELTEACTSQHFQCCAFDHSATSPNLQHTDYNTINPLCQVKIILFYLIKFQKTLDILSL